MPFDGEDIPVGGDHLKTEVDLMLRKLQSADKVADWLAETVDDGSYSVILRRIAPVLKGIPVYVRQVGDRGPASLTRVLGMYRSFHRERDAHQVWLRGASFKNNAMNAETLVHELLHAATSRRLHLAALPGNESTRFAEIFNELKELLRDVRVARNEAWRNAKDYPHTRDGFDQFSWAEFGTGYYLDEHEFIAYGLTSYKFQQLLKKI